MNCATKSSEVEAPRDRTADYEDGDGDGDVIHVRLRTGVRGDLADFPLSASAGFTFTRKLATISSASS